MEAQFAPGARLRACAASSVLALLVSACGSSGGGSVGGAPTLTGVAATGLPIVNATVTVKASDGTSATATTDTNGSYSAVVTALGKPPYLIEVSGGTAGGAANANKYHALASGTGTANVTPITDLIVSSAAGVTDTSALFASGFTASKAAAITGTALTAARGAVEAKLKKLPIPIDLAGKDPVTTVFAAKTGDSMDDLLEALAAVNAKTGVKVSDIENDLVNNASAANIASVVVFGDSLSDGGTYALAAASANGGKFTTNPGPIWVENIATAMGYTLKPAVSSGYGVPTTVIAGGTNYAQGGARVSQQPGIGNDGTAKSASTVPVKTQIDNYLAANGNAFAPKTLVFVLAGANDIFYQLGLIGAGAATPAQAGANVAQAATDLIAQVQRIVQAGAKLVVVPNLPDIGKTPFGAKQGAQAAAVTQLVQAFNQTLAAGLAKLPVAQVDSYAFFNTVLASPSTYGFSNTASDACNVSVLPGNSSLFCSAATLVASGADQSYVFADDVHPTTGMHKVLSNYVLAQLPTLLAR